MSLPRIRDSTFHGDGQSGFLDSFPFDPAGLDSPTNQTKELKNGRLAVRARSHRGGLCMSWLLLRMAPVVNVFMCWRVLAWRCAFASHKVV